MSHHERTSVHPLTVKQAPPDSEPLTLKEMSQYLIHVRRAARWLVEAMDCMRYNARLHRRAAAKLKAQRNPFNAAKIRRYESIASEFDEVCKPSRDRLKSLGENLALASRFIDANTTIQQRCEMLNVNVADRGALTEEDGICHIVFGHGLEDSASSRGQDWNDGPLFQSQHLVFADFLMSERGEKLGRSLFEPGGMFEFIPRYVQASDGSMKRLPPQLRSVETSKGNKS